MCVCVYIKHILFTCLSDDGHLGCFHFWAIVSNAAINLGVIVSESWLSILLVIYWEVKLLDYMAILFNF